MFLSKKSEAYQGQYDIANSIAKVNNKQGDILIHLGQSFSGFVDIEIVLLFLYTYSEKKCSCLIIVKWTLFALDKLSDWHSFFNKISNFEIGASYPTNSVEMAFGFLPC